ncbi:MAG: hypothetical protein J6Q20_01195 [Alistipes sp.]|nr:hypothetical protein [Alistipes sp.]
MKKLLVIVVAALGLTGCFKKEGFDTTIVLYPKLQEISNGEFVVAEGVTAYAYYVSGEEWKVLSYEDAVEKVITNTKTNATKTEPAAESVPYAAEDAEPDELGRLKIKTTKQRVMLVALYPAAEMWAYRHYEAGMNLPTTTMKFHFRPWKSEEYTDSGWVFNRKPQPPTPEEGSGTEGNQTTQE